MVEPRRLPTALELEKRIKELEAADRPSLQTGGPGDNSGGMSERVTRIEEWAKQADARMGRVEGKLDQIILMLGGVATKSEMRNYLLTAIGLFVGLVALVFTGLSWLEGRSVQVPSAPAPAPIVIQVPAYQAPPQPPPAK